MWEVPVGAEVIGFSEKTGVEMFCVGNHILGIQGHPEYTKDILCNLIDRLVDSDSISVGFKNSSKLYQVYICMYVYVLHYYFILQKCFGEDAKARLEEAEPNNKWWDNLCKSFLKGE